MAAKLPFFIFIMASIAISASALADSDAAIASTPQPHQFNMYPTSLLANILSVLGFHDLSAIIHNSSALSSTLPVTIFAPTDSSILTCPSCSLPVLLEEHSLPGLYPLHFLRTLAFGTKIETLAPNRCLTVTSSSSTSTAVTSKKLFINGVEISKPDLFNNGFVIVHGLRGFVSHLSPLSCTIERMTTLAFPPHPPPTGAFFIMRLMLKDAMMRLRISGYSVVALAMRVKYPELSDLKSMTIFALDDGAIFAEGGGHSYIADLGFHIVPNRLLMASDLAALPPQAVLPTMDRGEELFVTSAGIGGPLAPLRINYMKINKFDMVYNNRVVVHGLSDPFPHVQPRVTDGTLGQMEGPEMGSPAKNGRPETMAPTPDVELMDNIEEVHHGL